ncbi:MAG: cob(I)yrinic acid a,c-diamide adenosyltransferase [Bdellovibrionota bacterium]|nr:cob(I)yrinic acid a,c-diamide adenosyltransferase [Bdellovibrionota bacterium]
MKIYTKTGDKGETSLLNGTRVVKYHPNIEAYGSVDELNSNIGMLIHLCENYQEEDLALLTEISKNLFSIGSALACEKPEEAKKFLNINSLDLEKLEIAIDKFSENLKELKNFILPGGGMPACQAHICRSVCRRAERWVLQLQAAEHEMIVSYLNRLSDYFFVLARYLNFLDKREDIIWKS